MKLYAHIADKGVREVISLHDDLVPGKDIFTVEFAADLVDITSLAPQPVVGWTFDGKVFTAPVSKPVDLRAYAASARYAKEVGGITVGNVPIATDRDSQALIDGLWVGAQLSSSGTVQYKSTAGYVSLSDAQVVTIVGAVKAHVQACRAAEQALDAGIAAGTVTTTAQVDAALAAVTS